VYKWKKKLNVPIKEENLNELNAGDVVYLTGNILTARDQAHKKAP
jgi:Tartrate dehydratase beta subunit/Fumarate hydratase class I, C-terminal domain